MNSIKLLTTTVFLLVISFTALPQNEQKSDSVNSQQEIDLKSVLKNYEEQRMADSVQKARLNEQLISMRNSGNSRVEDLQQQIIQIELQEKRRKELKEQQISFLRNSAKGYPVTGVMGDTLFSIYAKFGVLTAAERANRIMLKIKELYADDFYISDSLKVVSADDFTDIVYKETIVMSLSETDALIYNQPAVRKAGEFRNLIAKSIEEGHIENSLKKNLIRAGLVIGVLAIAIFLFWILGKGHTKLLAFLTLKKSNWFKNLAYRDYVFLNEDQQFSFAKTILNFIRWSFYLFLLYFAMSLIFSIFPLTRDWSEKLIHLILSPVKKTFLAIVDYFPNLFSILVIVVVMKYFIRLVKYIFTEIDAEKLTISGFHPDWALPTFSITKWLLYAFMFVLIWDFLPGSDSNIFKGVSVFIGVLFSLGSSSAISNVIAGLVITYMRPFKIGDRIKIGDITGDVIEKSMLVTRIKTPKNEEITIPNSSILSGNTTNYSTIARNEGLIIYSTVTIGYDVPWREMHKALLNAADRTTTLMKEPKPFVLQTSLDDFYVSYQINAYTREAGKMAGVYSELHQNIQDCCNEMGIEIMSPHYRAARDGSTSTIPANYLPGDYKAPGFNVTVEKKS